MSKAQLHQGYKKNKGQVAILVALFLSGLLLVIGLGVSTLMFQQLKMSGQTGRSVVAFYAADAGAEKCLYQYYNATGSGCGASGGGDISGELASGITYNAKYDGANIIRSLGTYTDTTRALQISW